MTETKIENSNYYNTRLEDVNPGTWFIWDYELYIKLPISKPHGCECFSIKDCVTTTHGYENRVHVLPHVTIDINPRSTEVRTDKDRLNFLEKHLIGGELKCKKGNSTFDSNIYPCNAESIRTTIDRAMDNL